ncbi:MAG: hypothetical protein F6K55_32695, partial [Moorea sp. SIO4A3]|nr:hypothetical protein [Moorena sp. SIO4A3]
RSYSPISHHYPEKAWNNRTWVSCDRRSRAKGDRNIYTIGKVMTTCWSVDDGVIG